MEVDNTSIESGNNLTNSNGTGSTRPLSNPASTEDVRRSGQHFTNGNGIVRTQSNPSPLVRRAAQISEIRSNPSKPNASGVRQSSQSPRIHEMGSAELSRRRPTNQNIMNDGISRRSDQSTRSASQISTGGFDESRGLNQIVTNDISNNRQRSTETTSDNSDAEEYSDSFMLTAVPDDLKHLSWREKAAYILIVENGYLANFEGTRMSKDNTTTTEDYELTDRSNRSKKNLLR